jgi:putative DNA primase/helicase
MATVTSIDGKKNFAPPPPPSGRDCPRDDWKGLLRMGKNGYIPDDLNILIALKFSPEFSCLFGYDEGWRTVVALRTPPFTTREQVPCWWQDEHTTLLAAWLIYQGFAKPSDRLIERCIQAVASVHPFHRVRDYLGLITWDHEKRIDTWLMRYFGAKDSPYTRAVGKCFLIAAVARALRPGSKVDNILILEGAQGLRKSSALQKLAGAEFFIDNLAAFGSRDASHQIAGYWIYEIAEIDRQIRGVAAGRTKSFVTTSVDYFRPAYARHRLRVPRDSIMVGSTNLQEYLVDSTGNRRFWPVWCERAEVEALALDRDALWAEAVHCYRAGEPWHLSPELEALAAIEQKRRVESHPWGELILPFLEKIAVDGKDVSIKEIFSGPLSGRDRTSGAEKAVVKILQGAGWIQARPRKDNPDRIRRYHKPRS